MSAYLTTRIDGRKTTVHRAVMEKALGRKLNSDEIVHHLNENKLDNRLENLTIMTPQEHNSLHHAKYPRVRICKVCGRDFEPHPTNRKFGKICSIECKRKLYSSSPIEQLTTEGVLVRVWETIREAARSLNVSHSNIIACCNGRQQTCKGYVWRYKNEKY